jgi:hypothetical protein
VERDVERSFEDKRNIANFVLTATVVYASVSRIPEHRRDCYITPGIGRDGSAYIG